MTPRILAAGAAAGRRLVRTRPIPYGRHLITEEDIEAVVEVLRSEWLTTGPKVAAFEEAVAASVGARYAVSFSSGTAALHGAVFAAGLGPGDEAVTSPLTFCATANCLLYQGAVPVFADVLPDTLTLDPAEIRRRVTPRTKAILPVDYAGHPADLDDILALAEARGLIVIEDACQALGARFRDRRIGALSHMTVFSFHPVKHITTGEGGMVTTNYPEFARRLRMFRNHGIAQDPHERSTREPWHYEMVALGYNYRLSDIGCALGLSQLKRLEANIARRRAIAERYTAVWQGLPCIRPPTVRAGVSPAWHLYPIRLDLAALPQGRAGVFRALREAQIGVAVHHIPVHTHPYYRQRFGDQRGAYPVAEGAYEELLTLPIFHAMTDEEVSEVLAAVEDALRRASHPEG